MLLLQELVPSNASGSVLWMGQIVEVIAVRVDLDDRT